LLFEALKIAGTLSIKKGARKSSKIVDYSTVTDLAKLRG
jgi:hypothetical protein